MKHIQTFESFLNEAASLNESTTFNDIKDKYVENPYGIGAQLVTFEEGERGNPSRLVFKHDEIGRRNQIESTLKSMGVPAKKLSRSTADKAYKYRYELTMYEF